MAVVESFAAGPFAVASSAVEPFAVEPFAVEAAAECKQEVLDLTHSEQTQPAVDVELVSPLRCSTLM